MRRTSARQPIPLQQSKTDIHLEFKPLVQVDPSVLQSGRVPLQNPRVGDYMLKQTASTEGIASKKSLELKKRYLLGENTMSSGIMKSDSTSMLDSKFKNFHSTISGCQKLLNPAPDISPAMQTFLKNTMIADAKLSSGGDLIAAKESAKASEDRDKREKGSEEKENIYDQIVSTKNELNKSDGPETPKAVKSYERELSSNNVLIENKIKETPPQKIIETVDLVTPEKLAQPPSFVDENCRIDVSEHKIKIRQSGDRSSVASGGEVIDLTLDSSNDAVKADILPLKVKTEAEQVGTASIAWVSSSCNRQDSSSSKTSSTSSPEDFPHQILDSTSPSTQVTPSEETRESRVGEDLMQMDSLMIIDGKYIGDPEDLKHLKMPDSLVNKPAEPKPSAVTSTSITTILSSPSAKDTKPSEGLKPIERVYRYESIYKRPELKFDTRNENKIDSLKNLPLILPASSEKPAKPQALNLPEPKKAHAIDLSDSDRTPTAANPGNLLSGSTAKAAATTPSGAVPSDSETETTGQVFTETELSDWTADDAVSENFVDIEFALNSNKGTIKRNKKRKSAALAKAQSQMQKNQIAAQSKECPIAKDLDFDGIEFMDTGSEESCMETYAATNKAMLQNRGYVQFVDPNAREHRGDYSRQLSNDKAKVTVNGGEAKSTVRGIDFIEQGACILTSEADLKTPVNEPAPAFVPKAKMESMDSQNDIEEDSLVLIASHGGNTTTEESDALTVVTSPLDAAPRNVAESSKCETPKKNRYSYGSDTTSSLTPAANRKDSDEITYEDYVRKLQMKISQISNARDSIDIRKTKRKHSKGDISGSSVELRKSQETLSPNNSVIDKHNSSSKSLSIYVGKDEPEPAATVGEKLEELTKERTKRKDLIHDLVMDKLQSKKQLNAEKRLIRTRNRSSALSISPHSLPPPPPAVSTSTASAAPTPAASASGSKPSNSPKSATENGVGSMQMLESERHHSAVQKSRMQRPLSENVEEFFATPKLSKTHSFCAFGQKPSFDSPPSRSQAQQAALQSYRNQFADHVNVYSTPVLPPRRKVDDDLTQSTDKMRQDARVRARLKSNQDLGLSPEEKIEQLRKRYHLESANLSKGYGVTPSKSVGQFHDATMPNKSDDMKVRERKMMASKSVNDIAATNLLSIDCANGSNSSQKLVDSSSDPNLLEEKAPSKRRSKDPERRKSIIQAVSDFFHKKKDKEPSSPKEKSEGMFGRFRISPKSKSKVQFSFIFEAHL